MHVFQFLYSRYTHIVMYVCTYVDVYVCRSMYICIYVYDIYAYCKYIECMCMHVNVY